MSLQVDASRHFEVVCMYRESHSDIRTFKVVLSVKHTVMLIYADNEQVVLQWVIKLKA
jgi:hypothetical protein